MTRLRRPTEAIQSSSVAIGAATAFVALSAMVSLMAERDPADATPMSAWALRGTIPPADLTPAGIPSQDRRAAWPHAAPARRVELRRQPFVRDGGPPGIT